MIKLPAYFTGFGSKADGSARLSFSTQEIQPEEFSEFKRNLNNFGFLLFKDSEIKVDDLPEEDIYDGKDMSPSKRLRSVLFVYWKKQTVEKSLTVPFNTFYNNYMEKVIEGIKSKLD